MAEKQVCLKLLVDKEKKRVLSAEAGKDFVDALLNFLTLPLGTIARIVGADSNLNAVRVGSLSSLYQSVADLEEKHFCTETCKEMLLWPRNSMESHQNPKLNIDDSKPLKYFICEDWDCSRRKSGALLSTFENKRCRCGNRMNQRISLHSSLLSEKNHEGYVNEWAVFTISDNLKVIPSNIESSVVLQKNFGIEEMDSVEEMIVNVDQKKMVDLLKCSFVSHTPLTDVFLQQKEVKEDFNPYGILSSDFENDKVQAYAENNHMKVKVMLRKSKSKVLFVQAKEDFVDFLLSFLTLPLGAVLNLLQGNSRSINIDNLFKSLAGLHVGRDLRSEKIKNILIKPPIAPQFKLQNLILPIDEATAPNYSCFIHRRGQIYLTKPQQYSSDYNIVCAPLTLLDPKCSSVDTSGPCAFAKGPSMYMVTDDLVVTPVSSISVASFLNKSKIPLHDLEERVISVGLKEALNILKASLISSSALTLGLGSSIDRAKKWEESRRKDNIDCIFSFFWEFILKRGNKV